MKRLSFIAQFKIEFLLSFTSCRKVLGKMPDIYIYIYIYLKHLLSFSSSTFVFIHTTFNTEASSLIFAKIKAKLSQFQY